MLYFLFSIILAPLNALRDTARFDNEATLIKLCKRGERDALDALFSRFYPEVYRMVIHFLGNREDIDDIVQTAMLEIHRSLPNFRGESKFSSWVYRITINVSNQYLRKEMNKPYLSDISDEILPDKSTGPLGTLEKSEELKTIYEIIRSMPEKKRDVFILAEIEQLSSEEMADILDCSLSAVWSRLYQARQLFWSKVEHTGYFTINAKR